MAPRAKTLPTTATRRLRVSVTLNGATNATVSVGGVAEDTIRNIEDIFGGSANDGLRGDGLANFFNGGGGNDTLLGGGGKDILDGAADKDTADYRDKTASVSVTLNGATNATVSVGGVAEDTIRNIEDIFGGSANDGLRGDGFANFFNGGGGNDTLLGGGGKDILDGAADKDTADYRDKTAAVVVTLNGATNAGVSVGGVAEDTIRNIEDIFGGSGHDVLGGDGLANFFNGGGGNDVLSGRGGNDILDGAAGVDIADYRDKAAAVSVTLNGATNASVLVGGVAEDTVRNIENFYSGSGADTLTGDTLANRLLGGGGTDRLAGMLGNDVLDGELGNDTLVFNTALGAANVDTILNYNVANDTIELENAIFIGLGAGTLAAGAFNTGTSATQADDRILFDTGTGRLFFDQDGLGGVAAQHFATLGAGLVGTVGSSDFFVV